jgi:hypothetical protein
VKSISVHHWPRPSVLTVLTRGVGVGVGGCQVALFIFVILAYQQAQHLFQSVKENQLSGGYILVLVSP